VRFVHQRHRDSVDDHVVLGDPVISVEESDWGVKRYVKYPDGKDLTFFFGMPNINFINGQVVDPVIKRANVIVFKVPVDDENHIHFEVRAIPLTGERGRAWIEERRELRTQAERDRPELVRAILSGKLRLSDVDPNRVDFVMLEDEVAQTGQGAIAVRGNEHLGRSDRGVFLLRKIWERELQNLAEGRPLKQWTYRSDMVPTYPTA
jgi:5,5'-dehydrodivanillate O-demethylase